MKFQNIAIMKRINFYPKIFGKPTESNLFENPLNDTRYIKKLHGKLKLFTNVF